MRIPLRNKAFVKRLYVHIDKTTAANMRSFHNFR